MTYQELYGDFEFYPPLEEAVEPLTLRLNTGDEVKHEVKLFYRVYAGSPQAAHLTRHVHLTMQLEEIGIRTPWVKRRSA